MLQPLSELEFTFFLFLCLAFVSVSLILAGERVRGAITTYTRSSEELGLAQLRLMRDLNASVIDLGPDDILHLLNQVVMDVSGQFPGIDSVVLIATAPAYVAAQGLDMRHYVFSPYRFTRTQHGQRLPGSIGQYVISPVDSNSFVIEQLESAYRLLATSMAADMDETPPALPRVPAWYLLVVPPDVGLDF